MLLGEERNTSATEEQQKGKIMIHITSNSIDILNHLPSPHFFCSNRKSNEFFPGIIVKLRKVWDELGHRICFIKLMRNVTGSVNFLMQEGKSWIKMIEIWNDSSILCFTLFYTHWFGFCFGNVGCVIIHNHGLFRDWDMILLEVKYSNSVEFK